MTAKELITYLENNCTPDTIILGCEECDSYPLSFDDIDFCFDENNQMYCIIGV